MTTSSHADTRGDPIMNENSPTRWWHAAQPSRTRDGDDLGNAADGDDAATTDDIQTVLTLETIPLIDPLPPPIEASMSNDPSHERTHLLTATTTTTTTTTTTNSPQDELRIVDQSRRWLYVSHLLAQFSEQAWQFALILFLAAVADYQSLLWVSTYGIASFSTVFLFGAAAGYFVDHVPRWYAAQVLITSQNVSVLLATACSYYLLGTLDMRDTWSLSDSTSILPSDTYSWMLLVGIHVFGSLAAILDRGLVVAMERDWIVVMSQVVAVIRQKQQQQQCNSDGSCNAPDTTNRDAEMAINLPNDCNDSNVSSTPESGSGENERLVEGTDQKENDIAGVCDDLGSKSGDDNDGKSIAALSAVTNAAVIVKPDQDNEDDKEPTVVPPDSQQSSFVASMQPDKQWLSDTNVTMKQIDLACKIVAPAISGFIIAAFDDDNSNDESSNQARVKASNLTGAALLVGVVNVAALIVEYYCTRQIYRSIPALAIKTISKACSKTSNVQVIKPSAPPTRRRVHPPQQPPSQVSTQSNVYHPPSQPPQSQQQQQQQHQRDLDPARKACCRLSSFCRPPQSWITYFEQPLASAGLGLAMLYLNVMSFGAIMTAYLVWRGMHLETVGIWRGVSSAAGLSGTLVYHLGVQRRMTLVNMGMWSVTYQFLCISVSFGSLLFFAGDTHYMIAMILLIAGVCCSRVGLWVFDIAVTQLMQEFVPDGIRGVVGGVQQSLNAFFMLLSFALGLVISNPKDFQIYASFGYVSVGLATLLYSSRVYLKAQTFTLSSEQDAPNGSSV